MKKIATILFASFLGYWVCKSAYTTASTTQSIGPIVNEPVFVHVIRDLELLDSWLLHGAYAESTIAILRHQNHKKILATYKIEPALFNRSLKYYLEDSSERAFEIYEKVHHALKALSI